MGPKDLYRKFFGFDEEDENEADAYYDSYEQELSVSSTRYDQPSKEEVPSYRSNVKRSTKAKVIPMNQQKKTEKASIHVIEPRVYSEVEQIADNLLKNQSVLLNFKRIDSEQAKRIVDFLTGTVYAIGGDIQRVGDEIFLCTPSSVDVEGMLSETIEEERSLY